MSMLSRFFGGNAPARVATVPTSRLAMSELGVAGAYTPNDGLNHDEFLTELRGERGVRKYREMRDNDPIIGAIMTALDMMLRTVNWELHATSDGAEAERVREFVHTVLFEDLSQTFPELISEILSFLTYGFSCMEVVYKRREGRKPFTRQHSSKYSDGMIGVHKFAPRAQWTIDRFVVTEQGDILGVVQMANWRATGEVFIPSSKMLLFRTTSMNNDPSGRSVLRNAYVPYYYVSRIQEIEAIAIDREMNGFPVGRVPGEYLADTATPAQRAFVSEFEKVLRDLRRNEQAYVILPSNMYQNENGTVSNTPMVGLELIASKGTRDIDTNKTIVRHHHDMARSVLADFVMLGQSDRGSFALSKSKTDLFLRATQGYVDSIAATFNRHFMPRLAALNGIPEELMPELGVTQVAPEDIEALGRYLESIFGGNVANVLSDDALAELAHKADVEFERREPQQAPVAPPPAPQEEAGEEEEDREEEEADDALPG